MTLLMIVTCMNIVKSEKNKRDFRQTHSDDNNITLLLRGG